MTTPSGASPGRTVARVFARDSAMLFAVRVYGAAVGFGVFVWLARVDSPETLGRWAAFLAVITVAGVAIDFGGDQLVTQRVARDPGAARDWVDRQTKQRLGFAILVGSIGSALVWWIEAAGERVAWLGAVLAVAGIVLGGPAAVLRVAHRTGRLALAIAIGQTVFLGGAAVILGGSDGAADRFGRLVFAFGAGGFVGGAVVHVLGRRALRTLAAQPLPPSESADSAGVFLGQAWPHGLAALAAMAYFQLDTVMLKGLVGDAAAGHYGAAYRLLSLLAAITGTLGVAVLPLAGRRVDSAERFRRIMGGCLALFASIGVLAWVVTAAVAEDLLRWLYADRMADYDVAIPIVRVLFAAGAFAAVGAAASIRLIALERARRWMGIVLVAVGVNAIANLIVIPRYGPLGAAWTTLGTEALVAVLAALDIVRGGVAGDGVTPEWARVVRWSVRLAIAAGIAWAIARSVGDPWWLAAAASVAGFACAGYALGLPVAIVSKSATSGGRASS